jgi:hypothetical protein
MREKKVTSLRDDDDTSPFRLNIPPIDLIFEEPPADTQQMALDDIITQLISNLATAAKDKADPLRPFRILAACHSIANAYTSAGFSIFDEFEHALQHDLHNALRMARRVFLRAMFLAPPHQFPEFISVLRETEWRTSGEAGEDYNMVVRELFDGDYLRPSALQERKRRNHA